MRLAKRRHGERLAFVHSARDGLPIPAPLGLEMKQEDFERPSRQLAIDPDLNFELRLVASRRCIGSSDDCYPRGIV